MKSISFWKEGETALKLKNMSEVALNVKSSLVVPRELTVLDESRTVDLPPKTEKDVAFAIKNFSALSGSNYQVLAVSEYERDGMHQTNIAPGTIKIHESKTLLGINYTYLYAILAGLIVLFLISQLFFPRNKK
jgi:hypothetical protein